MSVEIEVSSSIEFKVECGKCGSELNAEFTSSLDWLTVEECDKCYQINYDEGFHDGTNQ